MTRDEALVEETLSLAVKLNEKMQECHEANLHVIIYDDSQPVKHSAGNPPRKPAINLTIRKHMGSI